MPAPLVLLGPQRPEPNLRQALDALDVDGPILVISAGWRHDEGELDALIAHVGPITSLPLYRWFETARTHAPEIAAAYHERQERIQRFKDLYRLRVHAALDTVRELLRRHPNDPELVGPVLERASQVVRDIDAEALAAVDAVRAAYTQLHARFEVPWVREQRDKAALAIQAAGVVLIAGGHVAVLRNRMLFFGVEHALAARLVADGPVVAWGAGGMALTERIVLFYDDPPEGPAEPEVLDHGLGLCNDLVLFPHAHDRLRLNAGDRVAALARRFGPAHCVGLEHGAWLEQGAGGWRNRGTPGAAFRLAEDGRVIDLEAP